MKGVSGIFRCWIVVAKNTNKENFALVGKTYSIVHVCQHSTNQKYLNQTIRIQDYRLLLPVHQIFAGGIPPALPPHGSIWVILKK